MSPTAAAARAPSSSGASARVRRAAEPAIAALLALTALAIAWHGGVKGLGAVPEVLRALAATLALAVAAGYAPARLLVPRALWPHFPWLVVLAGLALASIELTALGFAGLPMAASLVVVLIAGGAAGALARHRLGPARPDAAELEAAGGRRVTLAWPAYLALLLVAIVLVPSFQNGVATVAGANPDALLGVASADFLAENHPTSIDTGGAIDRMPLVWRSKYPVYYALAGIATLSGLEAHEAFAALSALLAALAAAGFMLLARYGLGAGPGAAVLAMGLVAGDRALAHLALHPYHNQLWGTVALPLILLFGLRLLRRPALGDAALLALFGAIGLAAYPLMALFPALALGAAAVVAYREGRLALPRPRRPRGRRLLLALPVALLAVPAALAVGLGVGEKARSAGQLILTNSNLGPWRGDLTSYHELGFFVGVPGVLGPVAAVAVLVAAMLALRDVPRMASSALAAAFGGGIGFAAYFRGRDFGEYFHFKVLAFLAPLVLMAAAIFLARRMRSTPRAAHAAAAGAAVLVSLQVVGLAQESLRSGIQVDRPTFELRAAAKRLPPGASIRLDVPPDGRQLWAAYALSERPLSSLVPITYTTYPHVPRGRKADYVLVSRSIEHRRNPWLDTRGAPVFQNETFRIYRQRPGVPGPDNSSRRAIDALSAEIEGRPLPRVPR